MGLFKRKIRFREASFEIEDRMDVASRIVEQYGVRNQLGLEPMIYDLAQATGELAGLLTGSIKLETLKGKSVLVLNCGSVYAFERATGASGPDAWQVYPWSCRLFQEIGMRTLGVDAEPQADSETFARVQMDLFQNPERLKQVTEGKVFDFIWLLPFIYNDDASQAEIKEKMRALVAISMMVLDENGILRFEGKYYKKTKGKLRVLKPKHSD